MSASPPVRALLLPAATLGLFLAASSAPTPLYRLYQQAWGFSPSLLTLVFSVYAFSLLVALLTTGALSDHLGRRPVILAALVLEMASMAVFARADSVAWLMLARIVQGFATGIAGSALGAALLDVHHERGALVNTLAPMLGMALGVMGVTGWMALHHGTAATVFWTLLALFALLAVGVWRMRESAPRRPGAWASLRPRVRVPPPAREAFVRTAPMSMAVWALGGFYMSLGPSLLADVTGLAGLGGWAVCINTLSAAAGILLLRRRSARFLLRAGAVGLVAGLAILLVGTHLAHTPALLLASVVAGMGFGVGFQGALRMVMPLAEPHERGSLLAAVYVLSYLALSLPAIGAGLLAQRLGLVPATDVYGAGLIGLALMALASTARPLARRAGA
ncbi:MFS transporter [Bordetella hinzii]|uniref:Transporter, major facilitator family protein n=2 Tax=Bordetella hinzii TaxID=103855 RepID=A0ABR4R2J9_9BORD|nr:MFS transporter [Bordetella hinzii]AKQ57645.1 multidrug efflux system protein MdtL [Bordetella hinzii]KCB23524.1 transporter, major facilitator family protein [Bordetella hinzii OH87 BAL007II]KCB28205.1 transporter, major facilitator family protein [Bordetella hinzii L60]KCB32003.1 transporter, major facilitator family protein [Bordetella hinzii CA90 BAL1384]KCB42254.1 transporter, major facilitator family protein [Bordetella hinzii 4161]